jgi:pimeloyl-ACP methyl ester carboxylesterase
MVIPGWLADDRSTVPLRAYLRALGYDAHGWGEGVNRGPTFNSVVSLRRRLTARTAESGRPISLIGWSLGGYYASQLARRDPAMVRQVINLGTPVRIPAPGGKTGSVLADRLGKFPASTLVARTWDEPGRLRAPVTAVHSRSDAIAGWRGCIVPPARRSQNVEVHASHLGLGHHPAVLHLIADRLAHDITHWRPFRPSLLLRPFYLRY